MATMRIASLLIATLLFAGPAMAEECSGFDCDTPPPGAIACEGQNCAEAEGNRPDVCDGENCAVPQADAPEVCEGDDCPGGSGPEIIHIR